MKGQITGREMRRIEYARELLEETVEVDSAISGGKPVLKGTRFPVSRVLAELAEGKSLRSISKEYDLDVEKHKIPVLEQVKIVCHNPFGKRVVGCFNTENNRMIFLGYAKY